MGRESGCLSVLDLRNNDHNRVKQARAVAVEGDKAEVWASLNAYLTNARTRVVPEPLVPNTYRIHDDCIQDFCGFEYEPDWKIGNLQYPG